MYAYILYEQYFWLKQFKLREKNYLYKLGSPYFVLYRPLGSAVINPTLLLPLSVIKREKPSRIQYYNL